MARAAVPQPPCGAFLRRSCDVAAASRNLLLLTIETNCLRKLCRLPDDAASVLAAAAAVSTASGSCAAATPVAVALGAASPCCCSASSVAASVVCSLSMGSGSSSLHPRHMASTAAASSHGSGALGLARLPLWLCWVRGELTDGLWSAQLLLVLQALLCVLPAIAWRNWLNTLPCSQTPYST